MCWIWKLVTDYCSKVSIKISSFSHRRFSHRIWIKSPKIVIWIRHESHWKVHKSVQPCYRNSCNSYRKVYVHFSNGMIKKYTGPFFICKINWNLNPMELKMHHKFMKMRPFQSVEFKKNIHVQNQFIFLHFLFIYNFRLSSCQYSRTLMKCWCECNFICKKKLMRKNSEKKSKMWQTILSLNVLN